MNRDLAISVADVNIGVISLSEMHNLCCCAIESNSDWPCITAG